MISCSTSYTLIHKLTLVTFAMRSFNCIKYFTLVHFHTHQKSPMEPNRTKQNGWCYAHCKDRIPFNAEHTLVHCTVLIKLKANYCDGQKYSSCTICQKNAVLLYSVYIGKVGANYCKHWNWPNSMGFWLW